MHRAVCAGASFPGFLSKGSDVCVCLTTMGKKVCSTVSTASNIGHAALEGEMVTRVSKTRDPLSANGQDRSGDALLLHTQHNMHACIV